MCAKSCGASFVNQLQIVRCRMVNHLHFMSVGKTRMGGLVREGPRDGGGPQARKSPLAQEAPHTGFAHTDEIAKALQMALHDLQMD